MCFHLTKYTYHVVNPPLSILQVLKYILEIHSGRVLAPKSWGRRFKTKPRCKQFCLNKHNLLGHDWSLGSKIITISEDWFVLGRVTRLCLFIVFMPKEVGNNEHIWTNCPSVVVGRQLMMSIILMLSLLYIH